jgi:hypothetical protein
VIGVKNRNACEKVVEVEVTALTVTRRFDEIAHDVSVTVDCWMNTPPPTCDPFHIKANKTLYGMSCKRKRGEGEEMEMETEIADDDHEEEDFNVNTNKSDGDYDVMMII